MFLRRSPWQLILPISLFLSSSVFAQPADVDTIPEPTTTQEIEQETPALQQAPETLDADEQDADEQLEQPVIQKTQNTKPPISSASRASTASNDFAKEEQDQQEEPDADLDDADAIAPLFSESHIARAKSPDLTVRGNQGDLLERWNVTLDGYLRTAYTWIDDDPDLQLVGRNDGINFVDARLSLAGNMDNGLGFFFELNAAANIGADANYAPAHKLGVRLGDAYAFYRPYKFLELNLGQLKAPFDREELIPNSGMLFVNRSLGNRGVSPIEGRRADGLGIAREIGLQARGSHYFLAEDDKSNGPGISYALAVTDGQPENLSVNSNGKMAYYGRVGLHWGEEIQLGGAYFFNDTTFGVEPNRIKQELSGWTADLLLNMYGASIFANVMQRQANSPDLPNAPTTKSLAYQVQVAYQEPFFGFQPAYRLSYLDPTSDYGSGDTFELFEQDALTYHTIGLNYNASGYPVRVMANYTITAEHENRELDNDRFDILLQLTW